MGRRTRLFLVLACPVAAGSGVALVLGAAPVIVLLAAGGVLAAAGLATSPLLEFLDRPLARIRRAARDAADGEGTGRPMASRTGEAGRIARAVGDLAERTREAEAAARTQREIAGLFEHLGEGVAVLDGDGRVLRCNDGFREWVGREDVEGTRVSTLLRNPDIRDAVEGALAGRRSSRESRQGEEIYLVGASPFRDGALVTVRDLSELRRLEGIRRDFVANVSHELKTPLTSITGFAEVLAEGEPDTEKTREFGERILGNARRMRRLVDELLDLARVESGAWEPELETLDVAATARSVWRAHPRSSEADEPRLETDGASHSVRADSRALRQILQNLLDNARRYSPPDRPVAVGTRRDGERVRVEITDRGPGIPLAHRDRIFERFYRVDSGRARDEGGTGLGLAIAKHLVLAHEGEIGVESELERGTKVWFTLPAP